MQIKNANCTKNGHKNVTEVHDDRLIDGTMDERYQQHTPMAL